MNIQDWFPLGWSGLISLQSKGLSRVFSNTFPQTQFHLLNSESPLSSSWVSHFCTTSGNFLKAASKGNHRSYFISCVSGSLSIITCYPVVLKSLHHLGWTHLVFKNNFIYVFVAALGLGCFVGLSLVVTSGGYSSLRCSGFSLPWLLLLWSMDSRECGFQDLQLPGSVVEHELGCHEACGIFPDQGLNSYLLQWQVNSYPLWYQGSPWMHFCKQMWWSLIFWLVKKQQFRLYEC